MKKKIMIVLAFMLVFIALKAQTDRKAKDAEGLHTGMKAPLFEALDADSSMFSLTEQLRETPVVLIFYRGFWCPVCNKHLANIQDSLKLIETAGAKVIAVSPEKPLYLEDMAEQSGAEFTLLYDANYEIADAYDVSFKPSAFTRFTYNTFAGANMKETHSDESQQLPIPATYIINNKGVIVWRHFNPDYKKRASVKEILKALNNL